MCSCSWKQQTHSKLYSARHTGLLNWLERTLHWRPSIPPQLSAVIQNVSFNIDWEDFTADLKSNYPDIVQVVRLKNRTLQDLKLVKIEIKSVKLRNEILEQEFINIANTRHKVVEYLALANVLICSRCMVIGHFQKNSPQQNKVTCKTCGGKCSDITDHAFSGVPKYIDCGDAHHSNDSKCLSSRTIVQLSLELCSPNHRLS